MVTPELNSPAHVVTRFDAFWGEAREGENDCRLIVEAYAMSRIENNKPSAVVNQNLDPREHSDYGI